MTSFAEKKKIKELIKKVHDELLKNMSEEDIGTLLELHNLDVIYDDDFLADRKTLHNMLEIFICSYFQLKGEKYLLEIEIKKLKTEISKLKAGVK